jgi:hypothetical protein
MVRKAWLFGVVAALALSACVHVPPGPNVLVLPGAGKSFEEFTVDADTCRQWAAEQAGLTARRAANDAAVGGAAAGTVLGAATGAAIGAASGHPATGAAVGAGLGLLGGSAVGASNAESARWAIQRRYDMAYMQCMYAKGHQIPVAAGSRPQVRWQPPPPPPPRAAPNDLPPPPPGAPPLPPPGAS